MVGGLYYVESVSTLHGMRVLPDEERITLIAGLSFSHFVWFLRPVLRLAGAEEDVDEASHYVDQAGDGEDLVPLGHLAGARHAGDDDGGEEPGDLGHGVGDTKEDPGVGPGHLRVGEVESSGDGKLVERHPEGYQDDVAHLVLTRQEPDANEGEGGTEEADAVEDLPESGDLTAVPGPDHVEHLPCRGENQHPQCWQHRQQSVLSDGESQRLPDED